MLVSKLLESFAIVQELADRTGMSVPSFVSMAAMRHALELKKELKTLTARSTTLSPEDSRHFTELMENPEKYFGNTNAEFRRLAKKLILKVD